MFELLPVRNKDGAETAPSSFQDDGAGGEFSDVTRSYAGKGVVRYAW